MSVRIVWVVDLLQVAYPQEVTFDSEDVPTKLQGIENYFQSKVGFTWLAEKFADRLGSKGIMSTSLHPGLTSNASVEKHGLVDEFRLATHHRKSPEYVAFSELYAGFSDIPHSHTGGHLMVWGRIADAPELL